MCDVFHARWGLSFQPFHNPVDFHAWQRFARTDWKNKEPFRIRYGGRIGRAIQSSVLDVCKVVSELNNEGIPVVFEIYTSSPGGLHDVASKHKGVTVNNMIPYADLPASLAKTDLLLISYDFDQDSGLFAQYSMPTKATEYMASGTPVLVYAPAKFAATQYAQDEGWGYVVSERNQTMLREAIKRLIGDIGLREHLGRRGMELVKQNHDAERIREAFRKKMAEAATPGKATKG
jgi:glycosyltransferase involved in cell wall biosynthesis